MLPAGGAGDGEGSTLSPHKLNCRAAPAFPGKQGDPNGILTSKDELVTGLVASNVGLGQQQNQETKGREGIGQSVFALKLYAQPVYSLPL